MVHQGQISFFDRSEQAASLEKLQEEFPVIREKKVILYAPTFRDQELDAPAIALDMDKMYQRFHHEYVIFLRLHPAVNHTYENKHPGFVYNVSNGFSVNELLVAADVLITDYSSIPFEYALLHRPMIFFAYDLEAYMVNRGFTENYTDLVPGPIARDTDDVMDILETGYFDMEKISRFAREWNEYAHGESAASLVEAIYYPERVAEPQKAGQNA
ncbi:CDP-glycerol glycerophosphotransferase family protein [Virgibacillus halophilus]|uniref:CDP-glycerol glycerophosphotransferase family protein n=1 Tax=Tigheibacillus halophilus TaxID=361280 RepID=A0ABU5C4B0_9BACI|nr:CDP-glycerol glycerophosphotransferase family protein [Virgibacillus halophilus]